MPRFARLVVPGIMHHVTQRGNNREPVFFVSQDYEAYLSFLKEHVERFRLRVVGYCLMPNHVHLVATPETEEALALALGRAHWRYAQHVNRAHGRSGHLWQNRFYSCPMDPRHGWQALHYVERNPVRAGLVKRAWDYRWSSAAAHVGGQDDLGPLDLAVWREYGGAEEWRERLGAAEDREAVELLRLRTRTGWALGGKGFTEKVAAAFGRRVAPLPEGRPRRAGAAGSGN